MLTEEINKASREFGAFTSHATALINSMSHGEAVTDDQIGSALDQARAWVDYFGPQGPLCVGVPASTPSHVYVDVRARIGQLQRQAQQCVDYLEPLWEKRSSVQRNLARDEEECLQRVAQTEQLVKQRQESFTSNSSSMSPQQMQVFIQQFNDLRATVSCWLAEAKGQACTQRLQQLIQRIDWLQGEFKHFHHTQEVREQFQRQQAWRSPWLRY